MIKNIKIENFLTIKNIDLDFTEGLNVIVGESGAGKSLVLKAINEVFATKNNTQMIGNFGKDAIISIGFSADKEKTKFCFKKILKRHKSQIFLNEKTINSENALDIGNKAINIISQDYRSELLQSDKFLELIDLFIKNEPITNYKLTYNQVNQIKSELKTLKNKLRSIEDKKPEILIDFIEENNPKPDEYDTLLEQRNILKQNLAIKDLMQSLKDSLFDSNDSFNDLILRALKKIDKYRFEKANFIKQSLDKIIEELLVLKPLIIDMEVSDYSIDDIEKRLFELETLQRKFGKSINEILIDYDIFKDLIKQKENIQIQILNLEDSLKKQEKTLAIAAENLTEARKLEAKKLSLAVQKNMENLMLEFATFEVQFEKCAFSETGQDKLMLLFSANQDLEKKKISKIASGGEKSRFILALTQYISDFRQQTLIFDEIEEGTGNMTLEAIVKVLKEISKKNQLICITHSQKLQEKADKIFKIEKTYDDSKTLTYLCQN